MSETYLCFILKVIKTQTGIYIDYYHNQRQAQASNHSSILHKFYTTACWISLHY